MTGEMSIVRKACCEAVWRAAIQRGPFESPLFVDAQRPTARRELAHLVQSLPQDIIDTITIREITRHGQLAGGYSMRWSARYLSQTCREPSDRANGLYENPPRFDGRGSDSAGRSEGSAIIEDDRESLSSLFADQDTLRACDTKAF